MRGGCHGKSICRKRGGLTGPHKDGWGIAYYQDGDVNLIRDAGQAGRIGGGVVLAAGPALMAP